MTNFLVPQAQNLKSQFLNMSPSLPSYYSNHLQNRFRIWPLLTTSIAITLVPPSILSHLDYWNSLSASSLSALQSILNTAAKVIDLFKMLVLHFHSSAQNPQMTSPVRQFNNLKCSAPHSPYYDPGPWELLTSSLIPCPLVHTPLVTLASLPFLRCARQTLISGLLPLLLPHRYRSSPR